MPPSEEAPTGWWRHCMHQPQCDPSSRSTDRPNTRPGVDNGFAPPPPQGHAIGCKAAVQPLFPSSFFYGWAMTKEPVAGMYQAASLHLTAEPFQMPDPFGDAVAPDALLTWGERVEWVEQ